MFCSRCGSSLPDGSHFCTHCGAQLAKAVPAAAAPMGAAVSRGPVNVKLVAIVAAACVLVGIAAFAVWALFFSPYAIDEERFPDAVLRAQVSAQLDPDGDGKITRDEAAAVESLAIDGAASLTGLDTFANLRELTLSGDALQTADLSSCASLEAVDAGACPALAELVLPENSALRTIEAPGTQLSALDLSRAPLLETLDVTGCPVAELAVGQCPSLASLSACGSGLTSLDVASNPALAELRIDDGVALANLDATPLHEVWVVDSLSHTVPSVNATEGYTVSAQGTYDEAGRLIKIGGYRYDQEFSYAYAYDEAGRCIAMDDAGSNGSPAVHWDIAYDEAGRIQRASSDMGDVWEYSYGEGESPVSCAIGVGQGGSSRVQYAYNDQGLLSSYAVSYGVGGAGSGRVIAYDADGRVSSVADDPAVPAGAGPGDYQVTRDDAGRITEVAFDWGTFGSYRQTRAYNGDGTLSNVAREVKASSANMSHSYFPVTKTAFKYDETGRLQSWEPTYADSYGNKEVNGSNAVTYKRFITADADFAPQGFVNLGDILSPTFEPHFWNPAEVLTETGEIAFSGVPAAF